MTPAHFHIAASHIPIVAVPLLLFLLIAGMTFKKRDLQWTALIGLILVALATIPIFLSGEEAEELVEHLPNISEELVESHESSGKLAFILVLITGGISAGSLLFSKLRMSWAPYLISATLVAGLASTGALVWAGNQGGKIEHLHVIDDTSSKSSVKSYEKHDHD